jgi:hypothetical protein
VTTKDKKRCANGDAKGPLACPNPAVPGHIYCDRCREEGGGYPKAKKK